MKVIFLQDVPNVARAGDVKEVADGHARNYLIPRKLAVLATGEELKKVDALRQAAERRRAQEERTAADIAEAIQGIQVRIGAKVGGQGRLYGSVTSADIAEEVARLTGHEIDKRKVELDEPIRGLGEYDVPVRLTREISATVRVLVEEEKAPA